MGVTRRYVPILKSKQGELNALKNMYGPEVSGASPLIEVVNGSGGDSGEAVDSVAKKLAAAWLPSRPPLMVDAIEIEPEGDEDSGSAPAGGPSIRALMDSLRQARVPALPVVRLTDPPALFEALWDSCARDGYGACLRVTPDDLDDSVLPLDRLLEARVDDLGIRNPEQVDVVLDFGTLADDNAVAMASRLGRFVVGDLTRQPWRTVAVASGAFPSDLSGVQPNTFGSLPRRDRQLWLQLNRLDLGRPLDFGDYAVTNPLLPAGTAFAAPPQLRYTVEEEWLVRKGRRQDRRGHEQFFDICAALLDELGPRFDPSLSWGDGRIHDAAISVQSRVVGPGNASTWRAIATSHHLAYVVRSLAERDEP